MACSYKQLQLVVFVFMVGMTTAEAQSEVASPPLDANIVDCTQHKVTLGLCVQKELLNYITTRKLDFGSCCKIVDGITKDCYPFVSTDPVFGLIYNQFCRSPAPSPPSN